MTSAFWHILRKPCAREASIPVYQMDTKVNQLEVKAPPPEGRWLRCVDFKSTSGIVAYGEVIVTFPLDLVLHLDVLGDDVIRYVPTTCNEVAPSPEMSTPELPCQSFVFAQQLAGCLSLEPLEELGY